VILSADEPRHLSSTRSPASDYRNFSNALEPFHAKVTVLMPPDSDEFPPSPRFATTRWTLLGNAGEASRRDRAWEHFSRSYWYPVYAFIRRRGYGPDDASDLTQAFFAKLIEQDWLSRVEQRDTRFSTLLVTILKNFLIKSHHRETAQKRGGGAQPVSLDLAHAEHWFGQEPATHEAPEALFEKRWAHAVMEAALARLREEYDDNGKGKVFELISQFLYREAVPGDYDAVGEQLGIHGRSVAVAVYRMRTDFRAMVREEVAAGMRDESLVEEEMKALVELLGT
jgi:DNA-directed RNA polymerase specialized sigma24 family protein